MLDHVLDVIATAADLNTCHLAFVIGYLGEQVRDHMQVFYPDVPTRYYVQDEMRGQAHAIAMAHQELNGPTLILFTDTIVMDDMSFLQDPGFEEEAVIWVKQVPDPRRFGVVEIGTDGYVHNIIEKPDTMENDLAVVGCYYFKKGEDLLSAIQRQIREDISKKGEFYIADAIDLMIRDGLKLLPRPVDVWLDTGLPETVLETNRYLLSHRSQDTKSFDVKRGVKIIPPVHIHPEAEIVDSIIGPHVSVARGCKIRDSEVSESVVEEGAEISRSQLTDSLIGAYTEISDVSGSLNIGDHSVVRGKR